MIPVTHHFPYDIAFGIVSYIVINIFCGDVKKIKASTWVIAALFVAMLVLTHQMLANLDASASVRSRGVFLLPV